MAYSGKITIYKFLDQWYLTEADALKASEEWHSLNTWRMEKGVRVSKFSIPLSSSGVVAVLNGKIEGVYEKTLSEKETKIMAKFATSQSSRERHARLYYKRKEAGLCPRCGKERDSPSRITCEKCRAHSNKAHTKRYWRLVELNMCTTCEVILGNHPYRICTECAENTRQDRKVKYEEDKNKRRDMQG